MYCMSSGTAMQARTSPWHAKHQNSLRDGAFVLSLAMVTSMPQGKPQAPDTCTQGRARPQEDPVGRATSWHEEGAAHNPRQFGHVSAMAMRAPPLMMLDSGTNSCISR